MFDMQAPAIPFTTIRENRGRRLKLSVNRQGGVVVTVPPHTPQLMINRFVNQNVEWIIKQQATVSHAKVLPDDKILLFGNLYQLQSIYEPKKASGCRLSDSVLEINTLTPDLALSHKKVRQALDRFLRTTASHYILQRVPQWAAKMEIDYTKIQLREQRSRWGSCSSTGTLNFNWRLVHAPPAVVDYVIIHELAHRNEMNHSARFWRIVANFDPAHQEHRGWLKREGRWVFPTGGEAD